MADDLTAPAISCRDLTRSFDHDTGRRGTGRQTSFAVDGVTFDVARGSVLALLGHNGAGKTTTIRLLNGVLRPHGGSSRVLGFDPVVDGTEVRRRTGVVTENAGLDDRLTAREHLVTAARLRGIDDSMATRRAGELLERFGMGDHADQVCRGFSTGQRRRVALARALVHDPELLILDEPTSGLDPAGARAVMDLIETSARDRGRTIVLCTHFLAEAGATADLMAVLHRGRLAEFGRPAELAAARWPGLDVHVDLGEPASPAVLDLLARHAAVRASSIVTDGVVVTLDGRSDIPTVVAALVAGGFAVYGTAARNKGLEEVYFAIQQELAADLAWTGSELVA